MEYALRLLVSERGDLKGRIMYYSNPEDKEALKLYRTRLNSVNKAIKALEGFVKTYKCKTPAN